MQSIITMAPAEFPPFQPSVQVKHEDAMGLSGPSDKSRHPKEQSMIPAQLQQLSHTQPHPQATEVQVQPQAQTQAQAQYKHAVPFNRLSFHNPFDINSYPITNPPLYDPTMHVPYGGTRHRRISISNGQIGQIVNHEAYFVDEDSFDEFYAPDKPRQTFQDDTFAGTLSSNQVNVGSNLNGGVGAGTQWNMNSSRPVSTMPAEIPAQPLAANLVPGEVPEVANTGGVTTPVADTTMKQESTDVAGLPPPNHTLIYDNEVIYNPNDGPIPGTAAWKKERLLERNRVAASKCRQRKKQAQQQLQHDISKFESAIKEKEEKLQKLGKLVSMYNAVLKEHFDGNSEALETLRPFLENPEA